MHWCSENSDCNHKGKGELQTFWLDLQRKNKTGANTSTTYAESNFSSFDDGDGDEPLPKRSTGTATSTSEDYDGYAVPLSTSSFHDDSTFNGADSLEDQVMNLPSLLHPHESSNNDGDEADLSRSLSQPFRHQQHHQQRRQSHHLHDSSNIDYGYEDHNRDNIGSEDHNNHDDDSSSNDDSNSTNDTEKIILKEARKLSLKEGGSGSERQVMRRKSSLVGC
jgi:hypothetical protein